jgi:hypothetical protein
MPRRVSNPDRLLALDENLVVVAVPRRQPRKRKPSCGPRRRQYSTKIELRRPAPPGDSIMRFRRLLLAALRVWELKNGIHDYNDSVLD